MKFPWFLQWLLGGGGWNKNGWMWWIADGLLVQPEFSN
jgi:hypothetical protein